MSAPCARSDSPTTDSAALLTALVVITAAAAIRLAIAAVFRLPPDETYYWEWSRHLASGYFDHPPGVALLVRAGVSLFGDTPIGVRAGAIAAGWGASLAVVLLANRLGGARAALRAGAIITCMPLAAAGLMLATPDAPLLVTVALTLLALDGAVAAPPGSARSLAWWLGAGVALGAAFLSKYNAALLPLTILVALLAAPALRRHLATPAPYLAAAVALLVFAPVVVWNAHHDWISFRFQLLHGLGPARGSVIEREGDLLGGQLALVSPVLLPLLALAVARSLRPAAPREFLLAVVAAAIFLFFCVSALRQPAEANWQAPAYVPAIVVLAIVANTPRWRRWLAVACAVGGIMTAAMYIQAVHPFLPIAAADDPTARGTGWEELATRMTAIAAAHPAPPGARTWFGGDRYQEASELAFHLPGHPTTFSLNLGGRANAYDAWPPFPERARPGDNLVLALEITAHGTDDSVAVLLRPHFERAQLVSTVGLYRGRELRDERHIWILHGWRGTWPAVACRSCLPGRGPGISAHGRSSVLASPVR